MWLGFCAYGSGWVFCLMLVVGYLSIVMVGFFVYGSDCVFVLMVVVGFWFMVVVGFLFNVGGEFFVYGGG